MSEHKKLWALNNSPHITMCFTLLAYQTRDQETSLRKFSLTSFFFSYLSALRITEHADKRSKNISGGTKRKVGSLLKRAFLSGDRIGTRSHPAILDDETDRGLGRVKRCSTEEDHKVTIHSRQRPFFQNGGLVREIRVFYKCLSPQKRLLCTLKGRQFI